MNIITKQFFALSTALVGGVSLAHADPFVFTDGDLILGVQATAGAGSDKNVFFNLGPGTALRDNANQGVKGNIGATLTSVFGADWYTRIDMSFGVIANLRGNANSGFGSAPAVNNDPSRTFYLSTAADAPGQGTLAPAATYPGASLGAGATNLSGMEIMLVGDSATAGLTRETDGSAVLDQAVQPVPWANGWSAWNPTLGGAAFNVFTGGIQQSFGKGTPSTYVDIQRVLSTNTGAVPTGVVGGGTYEATIAISSTGTITMLGASASSAYTTWIDTFTGITLAADKLPTADPDKDGADNLEEFGFGGNPSSGSDQGFSQTFTVDSGGDTQKDLSLTLEVRSGAAFSLSSGDQVSATIDELVYRIEGSTDLVNWNSPVSVATTLPGSGTASSGYVLKTFRLDNSSGLAGKGFLRASVVK